MEIKPDYPFQPVLEAFIANPEKCTITPYGSGHINATFRVEGAGDPLLIQCINHSVFQDVEALMGNFTRVTEHILNINGNSGMPTIRLIRTLKGGSYFVDTGGHFWRAMELIPGCFTLDTVEESKQAAESGKALGRFHRFLEGFTVSALSVTLPDFHSMRTRFNQYNHALALADPYRKNLGREEMECIGEMYSLLLPLNDRIEKGDFPLRVVHNDPKINNVLFDAEGKAVCMIDLDTVMPGCLLHDFGDAIRTTANSAPEDETDLSKVRLETGYFRAYAEGFLGEMRDRLSREEAENLALAPALLTFIIGLRFFTDFLNNDRYYRIHYPLHNLHRAAVQFTLAKDILRKQKELNSILQPLLQSG